MDSELQANLWNKFTEGEVGCFKQLFKKYYPGLYGYGLKLCNNSELVEDCIQELFENVWQRRDELGHINSPNVYVYVSLRRMIFKKINRERKSERLEDIAEDNFCINFGIEELIIKRESKKFQIKKLHKALNQLSNREKEVLYLHYYNGMSYGEIEEILGVNRQSVRNYMYRAMETLRSMLNTDMMRLVPSFLFYFFY